MAIKLKDAESIIPAIKELERYFVIFNKALYEGKLPVPVITIQTAGRKVNNLGWFRAVSWRKNKASLPEINISAENLDRPVEMILETLIHEMVHFDNFVNEILDCSPGGYHNKKFKEGCDKVGLLCVKQKGRGLAGTALSPALEKLIKDHKPDAKPFQTIRLFTLPEDKKPGSRLKKWACDCTIIRCSVDTLDADCNLCGMHFEQAD